MVASSINPPSTPDVAEVPIDGGAFLVGVECIQFIEVGLVGGAGVQLPRPCHDVFRLPVLGLRGCVGELHTWILAGMRSALHE
jgi:hypothetical protein